MCGGFGSQFLCCVTRFAVWQFLVFLFWAVLVAAFLELGFQKIVRNCVELCRHAERLCYPCRVIVQNCAGALC
jgi:hypothetical protein